jgi:serine/threonine protein kinase
VQRTPEWWVKLGDFGLSKRQTDDTVYRTIAGTVNYMAPEVCLYMQSSNTSEYTNAVDIWALGCIVYRMMTQSVPFPDLLSLQNYVGGKLALSFDNLPSMAEAQAFARELMNPDPDKRPSASLALERSWLAASERHLALAIS